MSPTLFADHHGLAEFLHTPAHRHVGFSADGSRRRRPDAAGQPEPDLARRAAHNRAHRELARPARARLGRQRRRLQRLSHIRLWTARRSLHDPRREDVGRGSRTKGVH